jgi:hypothetical protein
MVQCLLVLIPVCLDLELLQLFICGNINLDFPLVDLNLINPDKLGNNFLQVLPRFEVALGDILARAYLHLGNLHHVEHLQGLRRLVDFFRHVEHLGQVFLCRVYHLH